MTKTQSMLIQLTAGRAERKIEAANLTEEEFLAIMMTAKKMPEGTADQILMFKAELGTETFDVLAKGEKFPELLKEWRDNIAERNLVTLRGKLIERVPELNQEEADAFLMVGLGQVPE